MTWHPEERPTMAALMNFRALCLLKGIDNIGDLMEKARKSESPFQEALIDLMEPQRLAAWKERGEPAPPKAEFIWQ